MERTPSPPPRVYTPPAPLHGPKHDKYDPFSPPRRSSRVAQRSVHQEQLSPQRARTTRAVTPASSHKKTATRTSNLTLSPPSSPVSPAKHRSPRSTRRINPEAGPVDSDSDHVAPTPARRFAANMEARGMLPTPAKTPRKRPLQSEESLSSTARILFSDRNATVEDALPAPRKARKSRKEVFSLESFADQMEEDSEKIEIYTDSKDRVPTHNEEEDNPFMIRKGKGKAKAAPKTRKLDEKTIKMNDAANRGEGMIYIFRGKKVFRKFDDVPRSNASDDGPEFSGDEVARQAGHEAHRPITRSSVKPRLLFQEEIQRREREKAEVEVDEEAVTDIEVPIATPSKKTRKSDIVHQQDTTPPPTVRRPKREISFDSWSRVKSSTRASSSSTEGRKRIGDALENPADKRMRTR